MSACLELLPTVVIPSSLTRKEWPWSAPSMTLSRRTRCSPSPGTPTGVCATGSAGDDLGGEDQGCVKAACLLDPGGHPAAVGERGGRRHADRRDLAVRPVDPDGGVNVVVAVKDEFDTVPAQNRKQVGRVGQTLDSGF